MPRLCVSTAALNHQATGMNPTVCQGQGLPQGQAPRPCLPLPPLPFPAPASPSPLASLGGSPLTSQVLGATDNFLLWGLVHVDLGTDTLPNSTSPTQPFSWLICAHYLLSHTDISSRELQGPWAVPPALQEGSSFVVLLLLVSVFLFKTLLG